MLTFLTVISLTERVCLGTNMADSNRRQGESHVGENQELFLYVERFCKSFWKESLTRTSSSFA